MSLLAALHSDKYYTNTSSTSSMKNVLVLTMPNTRNYTISTDLAGNNMVRTQDFQVTELPRSLSRGKGKRVFPIMNFSLSLQMNDYMAAYHDSVLLIGQVMRKILEKPQAEQQMEYVNVNYFRNISFTGKDEGT